MTSLERHGREPARRLARPRARYQPIDPARHVDGLWPCASPLKGLRELSRSPLDCWVGQFAKATLDEPSRGDGALRPNPDLYDGVSGVSDGALPVPTRTRRAFDPFDPFDPLALPAKTPRLGGAAISPGVTGSRRSCSWSLAFAPGAASSW